MKLHLNTVSNLLWDSLQQLMKMEEFRGFRIVGGTSLSLQLGHRESVDIDLFTDVPYGSVNFNLLDERIKGVFPHMETSTSDMVGMGKSYFIGNNASELVKLDVFYTDPFVYACLVESDIRFASLEEIAAMKLEVIGNGGRKKDFWDIHELLGQFSLIEMISFYLKRNPYGYSERELMNQLTNFSEADDDFTPNCYRNKVWELIKIDIQKEVKKFL